MAKGSVEDRLIGLADHVIDSAKKKKDPEFQIPVRALSNVEFNEKKRLIMMKDATTGRSFFNLGMARKFMQTILVGDALAELQRADLTTSLREIYYRTKHTLKDSSENTFDGQDESDPIIEDLEVTLEALREELHVAAEGRGSIVGNVTLIDNGDTIDCTRAGKAGHTVPSIVEEPGIKIKKCDADFILLIEKATQFNRLSEDKFWKKHRCVLITGNGQPPRGVRRLCRRIHDEFKKPVYVLVDNDPWGYYIYSVVKQGSINLAYESVRMAIPKARFLGLSSFDREGFDLPPNVTIKLNDQDRRRGEQMLKYPWFEKKQWQKEIQQLLKAGVKLELEALSAKGISFISEKYLPQKIEAKQWLV